MSAKKETKISTEGVRYKGYQLLRMPKYDNRIARIVIEPNKFYTFAEADAMIKNYSKKG